MIQPGTGDFELLLENEKNEDQVEVLLSGRVTVYRDDQHIGQPMQPDTQPLKVLKHTLNKDQFYNTFRNVGYQLDDCFAPLNTISFDGTGKKWLVRLK